MSDRLRPRQVTWAALLGRWVEFARSALALPTVGDTGRVRAAVSDIIAIQAVTFALRDLAELDVEQRALALDRAELLIDRHAAALDRRWSDRPMPDALADLVREARQALADAQAR